MLTDFTNIATGDLSFVGEFLVPNDILEGYQEWQAEFLGRGRYGVVIGLGEVGDDDDRLKLAIKKFVNPFKDEKHGQRCFRENQLLKELRHENTVNMVGLYTTDPNEESLQNVYLVMEYCGKDLSKILEDQTEGDSILSLEEIKSAICQLLRAVKYLNSAGVIHRDIRPENVAIDGHGKLTLIDFGFARVIDGNRQMTRDPGSSLYRAIETISFGGPEKMVYNEKVDIWAIGVLLCEMIIGTPVFEHKHPLIRAVELCGPIPENVLQTIDENESQEFLRTKSAKANRVNFVEFLKAEGREWLREDIERAGESLGSFIDRSLAFDHEKRMTVDEALAHPFLSSVRDISREHLAGHKMSDVEPRSVKEWKELVWNLIQSTPVKRLD